MPGRYTREGDVRELLAAVDDRFVVVAARRRDRALVRRRRAAAAARGLDAHVPAARRRLQQGDGHQLGEPRSGLAAAVPLDDARIRRRPRLSTSPSWFTRYNTRVVGRQVPRLAGVAAVTTTRLRYAVAACQTDLPNPRTRAEMRANTDRMIAMIDAAVDRQPAVPARAPRGVPGVRARRAGVRQRSRHCSSSWPSPIPNEHTDRLAHGRAQHDIYIQSGSMLEVDARWPGVVFNTTCLIGPERHPDPVPQGQPVDPVRGPRQPARHSGLRRAALPGRRHADRQARAARSATTGSSPRRFASSRPTARRC